MKYIIKDGNGNHLTDHGDFENWDDAEDHLCVFLDDDYDSDRGEYFIVKRGEKVGD